MQTAERLSLFRVRSVILASLWLTEPTIAQAADLKDLEDGLPITVEDASPLPYGEEQIQGIVRYDNLDDAADGDDLLLFEPRLSLGIAPDFELDISAPYFVGNADESDRGEIRIEGLQLLTPEGPFIPVLSLRVAGHFGYGSDDTDPVESELGLLLTKSVGRSEQAPQVHVNLSWLHNYNEGEDQREDRYRAAFGFSQPLTPNLLLAADLVREQQREKGDNANLVEAGLRWQLSPGAVLGTSLGTGIGEESPDFRATLGLQYTIGFFE